MVDVLNPANVLYLHLTKDEVNLMLKSPEIRDHGFLLGHPANSKRALMRATTPQNVGWMGPLVEGEAEVTYLLLQGKILGLVVEMKRE